MRNVFGKLLNALVATALLTSTMGNATASASAAQPLRAERTLKNGLRVIAVRNSLAPVVSTWMTYLAGSDDDGPTPGLAHAAEHMMFRGSRTVSGSQFADAVAMMGGDFNGETGSDATYYYLEVPAEHLDVAMHLEASRAAGVLDDAETWNRERGAISQEVTMRNSSAGYRLTTRVAANLLGGTVYADEALGTIDGFKRLTIDEIRAFHAKFYHPNNAIYVVVGDIDPEDVLARAERTFGGVPAGPLVARRADGAVKAVRQSRFIDTQSAVPSTYAVLGFQLPGNADPDYAAAKVLFECLGAPRGALRGLRADPDIVQISTAVRAFRGASVGFIGASIRRSADSDAAVARLEKTLRDLRVTGLAADEVNAAKRRLATDHALRASSIAQEARELSLAVALEGRSPAADAEAEARVTLDDVNRVLRTRVDVSSSAEGVAVSSPTGRPSRSDTTTGDRVAAIHATEHGPLPDFASSLTRVHAPEHWTSPAVSFLPNGIRLVTLHNPSANVVTLRGMVDAGGSSNESTGPGGIDLIIDRLYREARDGADGTSGLARVEDETGGAIETGRGFGFEVEPAQFESAAAALAQAETTPPLDAATIATATKRAAEDARGLSNSAAALGDASLCAALRGKDAPDCRLPSPETVAATRPSDVQRRLHQTFRPDRVTIAVVGNVTPAEARSTALRYFGGWHAVGDASTSPAASAVPSAHYRVTIPERGRVQSRVTMAKLLPITREHPDYVALRVANALLTGGTFGSLLYEDLRERTGLVYSVTSQLQSTRRDSTFEIAFGADADKVDPALSLVEGRLTALGTTPVDEARLERTKALIISSLPLAGESSWSAAQRILYYVSQGVPVDTAYREASEISHVTPGDVQRAVARWIRPADFTEVIQAPDKRVAGSAP